jgi:glucans biosynthesis protein
MRRYIVDFSRGDLAFYLGDPKAVEIIVTTSAGQVTATLRPNPHINGFRAIIVMALDASQDADIRAFLKAGNQRLMETWTALWKMT